MAGSGYIGGLASGNYGEVRQVAIMIQQQVEFNRTFGLAEISPGK